MTTSKTNPSTRSQSKPKIDERRLSEVARHVVVPSGIVSTGWGPVYRRIQKFGYEFDQWQQDLGALILGKRDNGEHAVTTDGVTLSIARQVAKTFMISRIIFALCSIFGNLTVLWTAHRVRTSDETFRKLATLAKSKRIAKYVAHVREGNGQQEILFTNDSRILFGAREGGFGRGFDEVDIIVFDEAQILTEKAMEDMVAAANQSRWEPGALVFFMGTPPRPIDPGEAFTNRRNDALKFREGKNFGSPTVGEDGIYVECSADRDADPDDRKQWEKGNPSFPLRTPLRSMMRLRKLLPSVDSWRREGLGIWDEEITTKSLISPEHWRMLLIGDADVLPVADRRVVGIKFSVDGSLVGLSIGVRPADGPVHVSGLRVASTAEGLGWIVQWCEQRRESIDQIVIDGKSGATSLVSALIDAGFQPRSKVKKPSSRFIRIPTLDEYISAHVEFLTAVRAEDLSHGDSPLLDEQVAGSMKRPIGNLGGWGWQPIRDTDNTTLLDSATLAWWGAKTCTRGKQKGVRIR